MTKDKNQSQSEYSGIKKLALFLLIAFIITVVLLKISYNKTEQSDKQQQSEQKEILAGSESGLETNGAEYVDKNIGKLDKDAANRLVIDYEKLLKKRKSAYEKRFVSLELDKKLYNYFTGVDNSKSSVFDRIDNRNDYQEVQSVYDAGLTFAVGNLRVYPIIDYVSIMDKYGSYMYDSVKKYISIKVLAVNDPVILGNKLQISYNELGQRLVDIEGILYDENIAPDPSVTIVKSVVKDKIDDEILSDLFYLYEMYYYLYVKGNSSGATYNIIDGYGRIKAEVLASYESVIQTAPKTELGKGLVSYVEWLESHNNKVTNNELNAYFNTDKTVQNIRNRTKF